MRRTAQVVLAPFYWLASTFSGLLYWTFNWEKREVAPAKSLESKLPPREAYAKLRTLHQPLDESLFRVAHLNEERNRYSNILPNEPTRFKMAHDRGFYFNANYVMEGKAVASQGPKDDEIHHFWKMVWHGEVDTIVMLANPIEQGRSKCSEYWNQPISGYFNPEVTTELLSEEPIHQEDDVRIVERKIKMTRDDEEKIVTQYHLQNWPDFGIVSPTILAKLVTIVSVKEGEGRLLAHCSAGVGRTGTFMAAYQAYQEKTDEVFSIAADLRDPQKGRVGMIQTAEQYELACNTASLLLT